MVAPMICCFIKVFLNPQPQAAPKLFIIHYSLKKRNCSAMPPFYVILENKIR